MASTPPPATGTPEQIAWQKWAEGLIRNALVDAGIARDGVESAIKQGSNAASLASAASLAGSQNAERTLAADSNNRIARPILDQQYWESIQAGRSYVFRVPSLVSPGSFENSVWRNVTWNPSGAFILQPSTNEGAEVTITPVLPIPTSGKIYVEAEYAPGLTPEIVIEWRDGSGVVFEPSILPSTVVASKTLVNVETAVSLGAVKYSVKLRRGSALGVGATYEPKVFEVVGTGGVSISPVGVAVENSGGTKTVEINPSLPTLAAPVAPALTTGSASVSVRWNGNLTTGIAPAHFSYVFAEEATAAGGPWTRVGQPLNRAGDIITRPPVGSTRWYRLTGVDTSNRSGAVSTSASVVVAGVGLPDVSGDLSGAITEAQETADGKNTIYASPTTPATLPADLKQGDLWYVLQDGTSIVTDIRIWNGTDWPPYRIVADSVVVPGSVGNIVLADGSITGPKVVARSLEGDALKVGSVKVDTLEPNIGSVIDIRINPSVQDVKSGLEQQQRYYRFDSQGLKIGDPTTNEELRLTPGRIEMVQAGNVPTWWEAQTFYVERMIVQAANIGAHRFEKYATGRTVIRPL